MHGLEEWREHPSEVPMRLHTNVRGNGVKLKPHKRG
jgi:hypothetical protein